MNEMGMTPRVIKSSDVNYGEMEIERLELTDELCEKIASFNGNLKTGQVRDILLRGIPVYTKLSCYQLER